MSYYPAHVIWYSDLEKLVKETYGVDIDIMDTIDDEFRGQNTYHELVVDGDSELDSFGDLEVVQHWINTGEHSYIDPEDIVIDYPADYDWNYHWVPDFYQIKLKHILHRLFKDGIIPGGKWLVTVWW